MLQLEIRQVPKAHKSVNVIPFRHVLVEHHAEYPHEHILLTVLLSLWVKGA